MSFSIQILCCLEEEGPLAAVELANRLGVNRNAVARYLGRMRKKRPNMPRCVHIAGWSVDAEGSRPYLRPLYGAGNRADVKKPEREPRARQQAEAQKRSLKRLAAASVFTLGAGQRAVIARRAALTRGTGTAKTAE